MATNLLGRIADAAITRIRLAVYRSALKETIVPAGKRSIRYAVVGLGHIAQVAVLPAFAHARRNSELVAVVSDDAAKTAGDRETIQA